jgi:hypothetical protein
MHDASPMPLLLIQSVRPCSPVCCSPCSRALQEIYFNVNDEASEVELYNAIYTGPGKPYETPQTFVSGPAATLPCTCVPSIHAAAVLLPACCYVLL